MYDFWLTQEEQRNKLKTLLKIKKNTSLGPFSGELADG